MKNHPSYFGSSVSHTTRAPREGEMDGVHYKFVQMQQFENGIKNGEYLEYAQTHTNFYGTHKDEVRRVMNDGKVCVLEIDVKGAQQIKEQHGELNCNFMFITCTAPPLETLRKRLEHRGTETEQQIETRLNTSRVELDFLEKNPSFFDYVLVNEDLGDCIKEMSSTLKQLYPWISL